MTRPTLLIDLERCIGCYTCKVACKQENGVAVGVDRNEVFEIGPSGEYPDIKGYFLPQPCMHCEDPPCVETCPTGASYRRDDGIVLINHDECILCEKCIKVCPYGARDFNSEINRIEGCTLCTHRIDAGGKPACVVHCMGQALIFGDMDDPQSVVFKYLKANQERKLHLLEDQGTKPKVTYLVPKCGILPEMDEILRRRHTKVKSRKRSVREKTFRKLIYLTWARGSTYRLLSRIWGYEIDNVFWDRLRNVSIPRLSEMPELDEAYRQLKKILGESRQGILKELASDYATLLGDAGPYESVHRSSKGLMMQDEWEQVLRFYAQVGLKRSNGIKEAEDHLALELECMAYLCNRMLCDLKAEINHKVRLSLEQQMALLKDHLLEWVPSFFDRVAQSAKTEFYRAMAVITLGLLKLDFKLLKETNLSKLPRQLNDSV